MTDKDDRRQLFRELGRYGALGLEMAISVVIGMGIGWYLDKRLGTAPWLMVLWIGFGFAAGVRSLYRAGIRAQREADEEDRKKDGKPGGH
jgi:ATP synthase protein I